MLRILVVANQTLGCGELIGELRRRAETTGCEMLLLVPANLASAHHVAGLPLSPPHDEDTVELMHRRLTTEMNWLKRAGVNVDGEVGSSDPVEAVTEVLSRREFDEVIVSTFPPGVSRWLRMDLPNRIRRRSKLPVTHVECKQPR
jgi:hypothetical protein